MLLLDAQTSGGLLICCAENNVKDMIRELSESGYTSTSVIGSVSEKGNKHLVIY
jgi:selenophosphate synthase